MNKILLYIKELMSPGKRRIVLLLFGVIFLLIYIFRPSTEPGNVQQNIVKTSEDVSQSTPEKTNLVGKKINEAESVFGKLLNTNEINQEFKSQEFAGGRDYDPVKVVTDNTNTIKAVLEPSSSLKTGDLEQQMIEGGLPNPDFEMYVLGEYMVKVYVFLSNGVAYEASEFGGQIFHKINFAPTDKAGFLSMFPNRYSESYIPNQY